MCHDVDHSSMMLIIVVLSDGGGLCVYLVLVIGSVICCLCCCFWCYAVLLCVGCIGSCSDGFARGPYVHFYVVM